MATGRVCLAWLAAAAFAASCGQGAASKSHDAGDWRAQMKEVRLSVRGADEDPSIVATTESLRLYLQDVLGLPVKIFAPVDYNGPIQALASGQLDMAVLGGGAYANVSGQIGPLAAPMLVRRQAEGNVGYYSALMVRADSPYHSIEDLRGKTLGYVDFNSTSGYLYPRMMMRRIGINPDTYFGKTSFAGGHTQAVMGLDRGQFDAALVMVSGGSPATGFTTGAHFTMAARGLIDIKNFRIIWSVGQIPNSPYVVRTDRPQEFIDMLRGVYALMPYERPDLALDSGGAAGADYAVVNHKTYEDIIALRQADIAERRSGAPLQAPTAPPNAPAAAPVKGDR